MIGVPAGLYAFPFSDGAAVCSGMTLRDWFAGQAITGCLAEATGLEHAAKEDLERAYQIGATNAYAIADAMLAARQTGGDA